MHLDEIFLPTPTPWRSVSAKSGKLKFLLGDKRTNPLISGCAMTSKIKLQVSPKSEKNNRNWHPTDTLARFSLPLASPMLRHSLLHLNPNSEFIFFIVLQLVSLELDARERDRIESSTTSPQKQSKKCTFPLFRYSPNRRVRRARLFTHIAKKKHFFVHFARWVLKQKEEKNMGMKNANASNFPFKWLTGFYWTVHFLDLQALLRFICLEYCNQSYLLNWNVTSAF